MSILKKPEAEQADAETTGERRQGERRKGGDRRQPGREGEYQGEERRKLDRRGPEVLRSELQWTRAAEAHEGGIKARSRRMLRGLFNKPSRILVLLMALGSGGVAAFLTTQRDVQPALPVIQAAPQVVAAKTTQILVAKREIGVGEQISETTVAWEDWPEASLRSEYITAAAAPMAIAEMSGSVARFEIFPGEPIRAQKLASASQGYLSAVLNAGMRAVSVSVAAESASGGFVNPNDHVDVVLTRKGPGAPPRTSPPPAHASRRRSCTMCGCWRSTRDLEK
ncbi:Flp pilus assembly protein CpaB [Breoghania sp. L-A4]|uniref:Flp pilus assembly protein CpaB n=1 Tax=Breoghania sp. L-A4 TaxID=2304600 RepID=UPI000E35B113|nr:Flp pilus assembly protein CpaB [Breoghania sp. L-A4]AXS41612.1 Flp pilus assembly protein CpaB [Breoghania sp. L-A4]